MAKVTLGNLQTEIERILNEYGNEVNDKMALVTEEIGKAGVKALKSESKEKFGQVKKRKRKYANTWTATVDRKRLYTTVTIHNTQPGLPHLLENGHVSRNGTGRTFPKVAGREHIAPVEEKLIKEYEVELERRL